MQQTAAARRYARALFEIAQEADQVGEIRGELEGLNKAVEESKELARVLLTPLRPAAERKAVVKALSAGGQISQTLYHFLAYLIDQRRLVALEAIGTEYARMADEASGLVTAEVRSASPLDDSRRESLRRVLEQRTGREVKLDVKVDASLIGGLVAQVGDLVFDGSVRTQLDRLRGNLIKGA